MSKDGLVLKEEEQHFTPYHFILTWETDYSLRHYHLLLRFLW